MTGHRLRYFRLSKSNIEQSISLVEQYRATRLASLQSSPESFSSTYEVEEQYPLTWWRSQLLDGMRETFICAIASDKEGITQQPQERREIWAGQLILRGPFSDASFQLPECAYEPDLVEKDRTTLCSWQISGVYVSPLHRGHAIAQQLIASAVEWLRSYSVHGQPLGISHRVRAMVRPDNVPSQSLLQKCGFVRAGTCTMREANVANGEILWSEKDKILPERYDVRSGHIYSYIVGAKSKETAEDVSKPNEY